MKFKCRLIALAISLNFSAHANLFKANAAIVDENYQVAATELNASATIGNAEAQFLLGVLNYQGNIGEINKIEAVAWFFMAAEYQYPNAIEYAKQAYSELDEEQQAQARLLAAKLKKQYGLAQLEADLLPTVHEEPVESQKLKKPAKMLVRGDLHYVRGTAHARNQSAINAMIRNGSSPSNLSKMLVNDDTGRVIVQYDVGQDGRSRDPEVLFSWPMGRFNKVSIESVLTSKFKPAINTEGKQEQYGLIAYSGFGFRDSGTLKSDYPHQYKRFKKLRNQADDNAKAKYLYACFLRAYGNFLPETDVESFEMVLLNAAEDGFPQAQYDYALQQIFINDDIDTGLPWLIKAAKNGFAPAEYRLGDLLYQSPSAYLEQDHSKAEKWLSLAAEQGHPRAQQKLAELWLANASGQNPSNNTLSDETLSKVITWLNEINETEASDADTQFLLAKAYQIKGDKTQAEKFIDEAIDQAENLKWDISAWQSFKTALKDPADSSTNADRKTSE
ncbi:MAG: hypothetical protein ACSHW0_14785 [Thalassotalea sp.]